MKRIVLLASAVIAMATIIRAGEPAKTEAASKEFEMIKGWVGNWKGTADMDGKPMETTTRFHLTAAGSAVVETLDAGTPHEMTNVYHDVSGKLMMTHYCSIGNAPEMKLAKSDGKSISLEAIKANGIDPKTTPHMHGLVYSWTDKDHLTATWTAANMGKEHAASTVFSYTRVAEDKPAK